MNVLLGQLGSNGDCLYSTTIARQIKKDFPSCRLTWAISSVCRDVIDHNPDVDEVWEFPMNSLDEMGAAWSLLEREACARVGRGDFDRLFLPQISPDNFRTYDGTIRPSLFRNYPRPITVPVETVIALTDEESAGVDAWFNASRAAGTKRVVLFECASRSGQSFVTPEFAFDVATKVVAASEDVAVILASRQVKQPSERRIVSAGSLSVREIARLTHHVDLFVGCGAALTVAATSPAAKLLPNIQLLDASTSVYASFKHDFEYFGKPTDRFLEMTDQSSERVASCVVEALDSGIVTARDRFGSTIRPEFSWYLKLLDLHVVRRGRYIDAANSLRVTAGRYGWNPDLLKFANAVVAPLIPHDRLFRHGHRQADIQAFFDELMPPRRSVAPELVAAHEPV